MAALTERPVARQGPQDILTVPGERLWPGRERRRHLDDHRGRDRLHRCERRFFQALHYATRKVIFTCASNQSMKPTQHFVVSSRSMSTLVFKVLGGLSLSRLMLKRTRMTLSWQRLIG